MSGFVITKKLTGQDKNIWHITASENETVVGWLYGKKTLNQVAKIESLHVEPSRRGKGIGSILLHEFSNTVHSEGIKEVTAVIGSLDINKEEEFYKKNGFTINDEYASMKL